jgi:hypothetical protein
VQRRFFTPTSLRITCAMRSQAHHHCCLIANFWNIAQTTAYPTSQIKSITYQSEEETKLPTLTAAQQLHLEQQLRECKRTLEDCERQFANAEQELVAVTREYNEANEMLNAQQRRHEAAWARLNDANKKHVKLKDAIFQTGQQIKRLEAERNQ